MSKRYLVIDVSNDTPVIFMESASEVQNYILGDHDANEEPIPSEEIPDLEVYEIVGELIKVTVVEETTRIVRVGGTKDE